MVGSKGLSAEKYNLIKSRLTGGGSASMSSPSGGQTESSNSGEQFHRIMDVLPPPGHPFLATRPIKPSPQTYTALPPPHSRTPTSVSNNHPEPFPSYVPPGLHEAPSNSLLLGLLATSPTPKSQYSTQDILSLVLRLSSLSLPPQAKKSGLLQLLKVPPTSVTEILVHQLLTMESGDLLCGVKCVLMNYTENQKEETAEVLEMTLAFLNKCLALQKSSTKLRSIVVGKSKELAVSSTMGKSMLEQLVMVSRARGNMTAVVEKDVCVEITKVLRSVQAGRLLGCCSSPCDLQLEVASWLKGELGMDMGATQPHFVKCIEEKYRVVEVSVLKEDMNEVSLSSCLLSKYPRQFWPANHQVRAAGAGLGVQESPCLCLTAVQFLPSGHLLAYTDMDCQNRLVKLDQELQFSQQGCARDLQPGHMVMGAMSAMKLSTSPLYKFTMARAVVMSISHQEDSVDLYLIDHGIKATMCPILLGSLPPSLKSLSPRLTICKVQGITPTPSTKLLTQSITTLSHLTNSSTASFLLIKQSLSTPKVLCQLLSSQQSDLINPVVDILYVLSSTTASCKHLSKSSHNNPCISMEIILPSLKTLFSTCLDSLSLRTVCRALETIHCLLLALQTPQLREVFSDGMLCSLLKEVETVHTLGQYKAVLDKILDLDQGMRGHVVPRREGKSNQGLNAMSNKKNAMIFKNTDIRERQPQYQGSNNPHRVVKTDGPVFASVGQLLIKQGVSSNMDKGVTMVQADMERKKLTKDAMKLFKQHQDKLVGASESQNTADCNVPTNGDSIANVELSLPVSTRPTMPATPIASISPHSSTDTGTVPSSAAPPTPRLETVTLTVPPLPAWLGGDCSSSEEDEEEEVCGLPSWLATPIQSMQTSIQDNAAQSAQPSQSPLPSQLSVNVNQLAKCVAQLPFSSALLSSSDSQEEEGKITASEQAKTTTVTKLVDMQINTNANLTNIPTKTTVSPQAGQSPEDFGSGTESCREGQTVREEQQQLTLVRDYILSEKHSLSVELWDIERKQQLDKNQLAVLICGFLNTQTGGTIYAGVKRNGLVRGVPLDRKDRDNTRQMLDRVLASMINPRVPPNVVDIDFVTVEDKSQYLCPYRLMVLMVKGQNKGLDRVYMAHNLTLKAQVGEGAYIRRGSGPAFNIKLSHHEMLRTVEKR